MSIFVNESVENPQLLQAAKRWWLFWTTATRKKTSPNGQVEHRFTKVGDSKFIKMKKILLFTVLLFQCAYVFGQEPQWSSWTSVSCYKGIQYSVNNLGYNKSTNSYWWNIKWKNNYSKAVSFDGVVTIDGESAIRGGWGNIQPGGIQTYTSVPYKSSSINFSVSVSKVCFSDKYGGCSETLEGWANYAECDNGTPNYKINKKNNVNASNSTSSNSSTGNYNNINDEIRDLQRRQALACGKLQQQGQPFNNRLCTEGYNGGLPQNDADTKKWVVQLRAQVKELEQITNTSKTNQQDNSGGQVIDRNAEIQRQNQEIANRNAEAKRQKELLRQQQEAEKLKAIEQVGGIVQDGAVNITQNSLADLQNTYQKEKELLKVLRGNEIKYPQATQYFNEYLKEKKKRKTLQWIGLGGCIAGVAAVGAAALSIDEEGNFNEGLMYGGIGLTTVGLGVTIFSIKPSAKGKDALEKARSYVTLGTTKNGIGLALNF